MALWTAEVFVDSSVGTTHPTVEAATAHGARQQIERLYGPVTQIVNLREVHGGGGVSSSSSGGCGLLFGVLLLVAAAALGGGGGGDETPVETPQAAPMEQVTKVPSRPEPQFRDYPTPPPSYCITENFEPC